MEEKTQEIIAEKERIAFLSGYLAAAFRQETALDLLGEANRELEKFESLEGIRVLTRPKKKIS